MLGTTRLETSYTVILLLLVYSCMLKSFTYRLGLAPRGRNKNLCQYKGMTALIFILNLASIL